MNLTNVRSLLQQFKFQRLFIEELGWSRPSTKEPLSVSVKDAEFNLQEISELSGVTVFEVFSPEGTIPDAKFRKALHAEARKLHHEHLLIFLDSERTQSLWSYIKREGGKDHPREHAYVKGQPGDLHIGKLSDIVFEIGDFDSSGKIDVATVASQLKKALDVERVTKKFYREFQDQHLEFVALIGGISDDRDRRWYASVLLNRLMFIYFLQRKGFLDTGDDAYLQNKLDASARKGPDLYYQNFLHLLFFEGFARPERERSPQAVKELGTITYLNGGLFLKHGLELTYPDITVPDIAFRNLFDLFSRYSWNLNDTPGGKDDEINPDVLGYIFEKYINQKQFGAYYTRPEITAYLCEETINRLVLEQVNTPIQHRVVSGRTFNSIQDLLFNLDEDLCRDLLQNVLPSLSLVDPACGSGAFLVAAMKTLVNLYGAVIGRIEFLHDRKLKEWLKTAQKEHTSIGYFIKKRIISDNLYGVDIMEEATEIAKLRLFLALVSSAHNVEELEPLPNIDFNILPGNSLVGLMRVDETAYNRFHEGDMFTPSYAALVAKKNRLVDLYRKGEEMHGERLLDIREQIEKSRMAAIATLNDMLASEFKDLGIKVEEATWDAKKNAVGKAHKRALLIGDIEALHPFHWGYEFDEIINTRGGFDAVITNPPWEIFKPNAKEFFEDYSDLVTKNKMTIKEFEKEQGKLLRDPEIRAPWLEYLSRFPHVSSYYRSAQQYINQISVVNGRKAGTDINLYKLFTEQCYNLLRDGGRCGIVIPSGIYTDLGTMQLREMLFTRTTITGLFGFENRKEIFEGVHRSFKFVALSFKKGGITEEFPVAFMRHDVEELERFPQDGALRIGVDLIRKLSPDSLSLMEFKDKLDIHIAEKMLRFPLLGEKIEGVWNLALSREFDMTNDSYLFKTEPGKRRLPLYEGKMIHQFEHRFAEPRYWVEEKDGRKGVLPAGELSNRKLDYQGYRLGFRDIAASTNERTLVSTIIPPAFHGNKLPTVKIFNNQEHRLIHDNDQLFNCSIWNSFVMDWYIRMKVTTTLNFFYIYQLPVPRITADHPFFSPIVTRAAKLICTTPEFDDLAREVGLGDHTKGATDPEERAQLRAELDGIIAHLYGLTESEFSHILATFPLVEESIKDAALAAYRATSPPVAAPSGGATSDPALDALLALIAGGENSATEFKETLEADNQTGKKHPGVLEGALKTIAAFLNTKGGGTLLLGVTDSGEIAGLDKDFALLSKGNPDKLELKLRSLLKDCFHPEPFGLVGISFVSIEKRCVCRVDVEASSDVMHFKELIYIRDGNRTLKLDGTKLTRWLLKRNGGSSTPPLPPTLEPTSPKSSDDDATGGDDDPHPPPTKNEPPAMTDGESPLPIDAYSTEELLIQIRKLFKQTPEPYEREDGIRGVALALGYKKVGSRIRAEVEKAMTTAVRRGIITRGDDNLYRIDCREIKDYPRDLLRDSLLAAIGTGWCEREEAIRAAARYLGFARTGVAITKAFKSVITGALQMGRLVKDGTMIRRG